MEREAFASAIHAALDKARRNEFAQCESDLTSLLDAVRDSAPRQARLALFFLVHLYLRSRRDFEAILLARHAMVLFQEAGDLRMETRCLLSIGMARYGLRINSDLTATLERLGDLVPQFPKKDGNWGLHLERAYITYADALQREDMDGARAAIEDLREAGPHVGQEAKLAELVALLCNARIATRGAEPQRAIAFLDQARSEGLIEAHHEPEWHMLRLDSWLGQGDLSAARETAAAALTAIEASVATIPSECIYFGKCLAGIFEDTLNDADAARRSYDVVATAIVSRIQEIDRCFDALPELRIPAEEYEDDLVSYRKAFLAEHEALMGRVSRLIESRKADLPASFFMGDPAAGLISVCAWCESMKDDRGHWIPLGHLLPRKGPIAITHSICPKCVEGLVDE